MGASFLLGYVNESLPTWCLVKAATYSAGTVPQMKTVTFILHTHDTRCELIVTWRYMKNAHITNAKLITKADSKRKVVSDANQSGLLSEINVIKKIK